MIEAFYTDEFVLPLPAGHRFPMEKYRILRDKVALSNREIRLSVPPAATVGQLALAHCPVYVQRIETGEVSANEQRDIGFPWSKAMVERSLRSVGATVAAVRSAMQHGASVNLAGGTHHAKRDRGGGFCVFNDLAVAARVYQTDWIANAGRLGPKVLVIDLDVHQGDGTAEILATDPTVFLTYELYKPDGTTVWQAPGEVGVVGLTGDGLSQGFNVTGKIPSDQWSIKTGNYSDTVVITVTFP